jgi:hypothetical protein
MLGLGESLPEEQLVSQVLLHLGEPELGGAVVAVGRLDLQEEAPGFLQARQRGVELAPAEHQDHVVVERHVE